jgi:hypothetical protein
MTPGVRLSASKLFFCGSGFQPRSSPLESLAFAKDRRRSHMRHANLLERNSIPGYAAAAIAFIVN